MGVIAPLPPAEQVRVSASLHRRWQHNVKRVVPTRGLPGTQTYWCVTCQIVWYVREGGVYTDSLALAELRKR